jgi:hypothetical protein
MSLDTPVSPRREVPEIVLIVLNQLTRLRSENEITQQKFDTQLDRLSAEELEPRGLSLCVRELPEGHRRFVIQDARGRVRETIDCNGKCELVAEECEAAELSEAVQRAS